VASYKGESIRLICDRTSPPKPHTGRLPEKDDEILLSLPLYYKTRFDDLSSYETVKINELDYKPVGIHYFSDNNKDGRIYLTDGGFDTLSAVEFLYRTDAPTATVTLSKNGAFAYNELLYVYPSSNLHGKQVQVHNAAYNALKNSDPALDCEIVLSFSYKNDAFSSSVSPTYQKKVEPQWITEGTGKEPTLEELQVSGVLISPDLLKEIGYEMLEGDYSQASLFFKSERRAQKVSAALTGEEFIALSSYATYTPSPAETIFSTIGASFLALLWVLFIVFIAFFINICSTRTLSSFKNEMAIMRSMGISENVIKTGVVTRMLIALLPGFAAVILCGILVATVPLINGLFDYLYFWQYALLFAGLLAIVSRVTAKQMKKLFGESVKKALAKKQ
jgi:hypothetical protein